MRKFGLTNQQLDMWFTSQRLKDITIQKIMAAAKLDDITVEDASSVSDYANPEPHPSIFKTLLEKAEGKKYI